MILVMLCSVHGYVTPVCCTSLIYVVAVYIFNSFRLSTFCDPCSLTGIVVSFGTAGARIILWNGIVTRVLDAQQITVAAAQQ